MQKILKRLELIKTAITLEDEEIIELQVIKLNSIQMDEDLETILNKITDKDYGSVVLEIEKYIQRYSGVVVYEDKELQGLRLELKALERLLQDLTVERDEYLNDINEFNVQYHTELGETIQKILNLKEELLEMATKARKDALDAIKETYNIIKEEYHNLKSQKDVKERELEELDEFDDAYDELYEELQELKNELDEKEQELNEKRRETKQAKQEYEEDEVTQEYEEVKRDSEEFSKEYEEVKSEERLELSAEEKKELKKLFRKASKLCHPDIVADELKEQAHEIMQTLNEAYAKRDLDKVKEILFSLESGKSFTVASDAIDDKDLLREKIIDIRDMLSACEVEVETIKDDEVIQILEEYEDIQEYFRNLQTELEAEYERLKNIDTKSIEPIKNDNYWNDEF